MKFGTAVYRLAILALVIGVPFQAMANGGTPRVRIEPPKKTLIFDCLLKDEESLRITETKVNGETEIKIVKGPVGYDVDLERIETLSWLPESSGTDDKRARVRLELVDESTIEGELVTGSNEEGFLLSGELTEGGVQVELDLQSCKELRQQTDS